MTLSLLAAEADRPYRRARSALLGAFWLMLAVALALAWLARRLFYSSRAYESFERDGPAAG